ncbi:hypothetical protein PV382_17910 [Streptomyces scabiei]|nr:hypothetical protein [Streptomyces scabiei]MDX2658304.1 hypothetical protein [Streptomyces scabiei]MDX2870589.1 hypothetical protein [Streptomyces scabiei]MDX3049875.1 hypothetical protein [Streptomyces scabiei]MDX3174152.1 hypothetical protein [Streptomyces scabiei]
MSTSGLPTARHQLPTGSDRRDFIDYNRALKVARITAKALELGCDHAISNEQMDAIAHEIDVNLPGSDETRAAVRAALENPLTTLRDNDADFVYAVVRAANDGHPFRYRDGRGRTVMLVPLPVER